MNQKIIRPYIIPLKIVTIVQTHAEDITNRLDRFDKHGVLIGNPTNRRYCPLEGYLSKTDEELSGCCAIRDPICYLERASNTRPKVESRDDCHIFRRVVELLYDTT